MATFEYLSVFISIVIGLAVVHVLRGLVALFSRPKEKRFWIHTGYVLYLLYYLPFFWWFTLGWQEQEVWTFQLFFFVVLYAMLMYVFCVTLVPVGSALDGGAETYFFDNHRRLFSIWTVILLTDTVDSYLKGPENLDRLGPTYVPTTLLFLVGSVIAAVTPNRRYHAAFLVVWWVSVLTDVFVLAAVFGEG